MHEPEVAGEYEERFRQAGAKVFAAPDLRGALHLAEHPVLAIAVINLRLADAPPRVSAVVLNI